MARYQTSECFLGQALFKVVSTFPERYTLCGYFEVLRDHQSGVFHFLSPFTSA